MDRTEKIAAVTGAICGVVLALSFIRHQQKLTEAKNREIAAQAELEIRAIKSAHAEMIKRIERGEIRSLEELQRVHHEVLDFHRIAVRES